MKEEYIIGWLDHQKKIMDKEILNLEKWFEESKADVKKAQEALSQFRYRLDEALTLRKYMDELDGLKRESEQESEALRGV